MEAVVNFEQLQHYYKGKKVFVTGHTGFKGAWLTTWLHIVGAEVKGYALAPEYDNCLYNLLRPLNVSESVIADIRSKEQLASEIISFEPDFLFHLAAQPLVRRSYEIPAETFEVNVTGTANVLEALVKLEKNCVAIVITTDKVYENKEQDILYKEEDVLGGHDPYSASKACTELVVSSFRKSFFNSSQEYQKPLSSVRAGNVIGGGDWSKDRIVPDIVRALQQGKFIEVRNPASVRPWQHVLEPLGGYLLLGGLMSATPRQFSKAYNFGPFPQDHLAVKALVDLAIQVWGSGNWKDVSDANQPHEAGLLKLDISRVIEELRWKPKLNASQAIEWTINWYKQTKDKQVDFTFKQINDYMWI
jgi:CDP-glucose 4,6-dehydratase